MDPRASGGAVEGEAAPIRSVAFDRAADDYDRTRSLSPESMGAVQRVLRGELEGRSCLEIGVGTGRIALPLSAVGMNMAGVDLALPMIRRLVEKAGSMPFPLAIADAVKLPFPDDCFGAGLACHVLHLIPLWRQALAELIRVVEPGGVVLIDLGNGGADWRGALHEEFRRRAGIEGQPGARDLDDLAEFMRSVGARTRPLATVMESRTTSIRAVLADLEDGVFSFTWPLDEPRRKEVAEQLRTWAQQRCGSLSRPRRTERAIRWFAYDLLT